MALCWYPRVTPLQPSNPRSLIRVSERRRVVEGIWNGQTVSKLIRKTGLRYPKVGLTSHSIGVCLTV
jgi:hypothetical protein